MVVCFRCQCRFRNGEQIFCCLFYPERFVWIINHQESKNVFKQTPVFCRAPCLAHFSTNIIVGIQSSFSCSSSYERTATNAIAIRKPYRFFERPTFDESTLCFCLDCWIVLCHFLPKWKIPGFCLGVSFCDPVAALLSWKKLLFGWCLSRTFCFRCFSVREICYHAFKSLEICFHPHPSCNGHSNYSIRFAGSQTGSIGCIL